MVIVALRQKAGRTRLLSIRRLGGVLLEGLATSGCVAHVLTDANIICVQYLQVAQLSLVLLSLWSPAAVAWTEGLLA